MFLLAFGITRYVKQWADRLHLLQLGMTEMAGRVR